MYDLSMYKMVNIYKITDCNGLIYIGSTKSTVRERLSNHRYEKKKGRIRCSSHKLDLDNCEIEVLEECDPKDKKEKLKYFMSYYNLFQ